MAIAKVKIPRFDRRNAGTALAAMGIAAFMAMMLIRPDLYLDSARRGLSLYATSVLPSLFPFYFCSLMLTSIGAAGTISKIFKKPMRLLYNVPSESGYIMLLSMLSGYPVGASTAAQLYADGILDGKDVAAISAFASTSGPIFMLGTVGAAIFTDVRAGAIVLASHYLAALINGFIYRRKKAGEDKRVSLSAMSTDSVLNKTISASTINMLYVGGYIVLCGMIADTLNFIGLDSLLASLSSEGAAAVKGVLFGMIEMTRGCIASREAGALSVAIAAWSVSFGGLSVILQSYSFLSKCGMKMYQVVIRKLTQAILAFGIALLLSGLL